MRTLFCILASPLMLIGIIVRVVILSLIVGYDLADDILKLIFDK